MQGGDESVEHSDKWQFEQVGKQIRDQAFSFRERLSRSATQSRGLGTEFLLEQSKWFTSYWTFEVFLVVELIYMNSLFSSGKIATFSYCTDIIFKNTTSKFLNLYNNWLLYSLFRLFVFFRKLRKFYMIILQFQWFSMAETHFFILLPFCPTARVPLIPFDLSIFEGSENQNARSRLWFFEFTSWVYNIQTVNVGIIVRDNVITNKRNFAAQLLGLSKF